MSSRVEEILNGTYEGKPQSRIEALLAGGAGSGGSGLSQAQVNNIVDTKIEEALNNLPPSGLSQDQVNSIVDAKIEEALDDLPSGGGNQLIIQPKKTVLLDQLTPFSSVGTVINLNQSIKEFDLIQIFAHMLYNTEHINGMVNEYYTNAIDYGNSNSSYSIVTLGSGTQGQSAFYVSADGTQLTSRGGDRCEIDKIVGIKNPSFFDESLLPVQDGLIRWYDAINNTGTGAHDNAASTWKDLTGNGDATVSGSDVWADNSVSPAYGYIVTDLLFDSAFYASKSFTFEAYVDMLLNDGTIYHPIIYNKTFCFQMNPSHLLELAIETVSNNSWTRWVANADDARPFAKKLIDMAVDPINKTVTFYIDGQQVYQGSFSAFTNSDSVPIVIGSVPPNSSDASRLHFRGLIHDVRIYDKALTPEEVQHNYAYSSQRYSNQPKIKIVNPPVFTSAEWDSLSVSEKKSKGEVIIRDAISGYERGILVNGSDYSPNPKISIIGDIGTATGKTFKIPSYGIYMVVMALPYEGTGSISMPQDATIISSIDRDDIANGRRLCVYIATLQRNSEVTINVSVSQWPGRAVFIAKIDNVQSIINTDVNVVAQADNTTTIDDSIKEYDNYYLIYGVGIGKQPGNARDSTPVNSDEIAVTTGDWGVNSANRIAICKGSKVPNYQFYGYDGGFSAIATWRIVTWLSDDPGESLTYKIEEPSQVIEEEDRENEEPAY